MAVRLAGPPGAGPVWGGSPSAAQERFKAEFRRRMEALAREPSTRAVRVWAFDAHRAGLKPIRRKVWAHRGQRPLAIGHQRFQWRYVYGFVRPATGKVVWFLAAFAWESGAGPDKLVVLVLDGAPDRMRNATRFHWWPQFA